MNNANTSTGYAVSSCNFDFHPVVTCDTYADALATAKARGWEARIMCADELVATWSPLYGTRVYNRDMAVAS